MRLTAPLPLWIIALLLLLVHSLTPARAGEHPQLLLRDDQGSRQPAPLLDTRVEMEISGLLARVKVRQSFRNPGSSWAEGIYRFPLPETAAVNRLRMEIGQRIIEGEIQKRQQARKTYTQAKAAGQRSSLVEQERPNLFTSSLANIAPGETVVVEISYQQTVDYDAGRFRLRFPSVVAPRYIPGTPLSGEQAILQVDGAGWALATNQVPDAPRITPPVQHPDADPLNPLQIVIRLDAGLPLARIDSPYHRIESAQSEDGSYRVRLAGADEIADRDFELSWQAQPASQPRAAWFSQSLDGKQYGLLMLLPPTQEPEQQPKATREITYVIDVSGSMHGESMEQARSALLLALDRLDPGDRFNIIAFNHAPTRLFRTAQPASQAQLHRARSFVRQLEAGGGTEMIPALKLALVSPAGQAALRQLVFLTDGSVGNEQALFELIRQRLGDSRLFAVGIGSAPNGYFMRKAAEYGRGSFTFIGDSVEVEQKMSALFQRIDNPALTDLQIRAEGGAGLQQLPQRTPDLYQGDPLLLAFAADRLPSVLEITGRIGNRDWRTRVQLSGSGGSSIAPEWGRRAIDQLMTRLNDAGESEQREALKQQVIETALRHQLVSRFTSLVAVDKTPARPADSPLDSQAMPVNLPKGWSHEKVFGLAQTATPAQLQLLLGTLLLLSAGLMWQLKRRTA